MMLEKLISKYATESGVIDFVLGAYVGAAMVFRY